MGLAGAARWVLRFQTRPKGAGVVWEVGAAPWRWRLRTAAGTEDKARGRRVLQRVGEGPTRLVVPRGTVVVVLPELPSEVRAW